METAFHRKLFAKLNISPNNYREDFWIRSPSKRSFQFQKIAETMLQENLQQNNKLRKCYIFLNNSYQGPTQLANGEFIDHPLSWPFEAFVDLNGLNFYLIPIYKRGKDIFFWQPDATIKPVKNIDQAFVILFPTAFCAELEEILMLSFIGEVRSLKFTVRIYTTPGKRLRLN